MYIFVNKALDDEWLPPASTGPAPSMRRITGSASIETLVRVGIEKENGLGPESKMVVLHDFTPCVDDELEVKRGQIVHVLYQENDWVYVISSDDNQEGFIPHSYCAQFGSQLAGLALNEAEAKQSKRSKKVSRKNYHLTNISTLFRKQFVFCFYWNTFLIRSCLVTLLRDFREGEGIFNSHLTTLVYHKQWRPLLKSRLRRRPQQLHPPQLGWYL